MVLGLAVQCPFTARYRGSETKTSTNRWIEITSEKTRTIALITIKHYKTPANIGYNVPLTTPSMNMSASLLLLASNEVTFFVVL